MLKRICRILIIITTVFAGCKKEGTGNVDPAESISGKVWTGHFKYTSQISQPVSMEFEAGGKMTWYEILGDFPGTWSVEKDQLKVQFPSGSGFTAAISKNNQLENIRNEEKNGWVLESANLNSTPDITLENTVYKAADNMLYHFETSYYMFMQDNLMLSAEVYYTKKAKAVRFNLSEKDHFFGTIISDTQIELTYQFIGSPNHPDMPIKLITK